MPKHRLVLVSLAAAAVAALSGCVVTPLPGYGYGYAGRVGFYGLHGRHRYYGAFVDPYWDPFYYPFPATVSYPVKTVSFQGGRVVAYQYLTPSGY